jgi:ABC-type branched-subunit amino acid transport system ATPase component
MSSSFVKGQLSNGADFAIHHGQIMTLIRNVESKTWTLKTISGVDYCLSDDSGRRIFNTLNRPEIFL